MKLATRMRTRALRLVPIVLICFVIIGVAGCGVFKKKPVGGAQTQASDTTLHKLSASAYEIANALDSGEKEFEAIYSSGLPGVSDDDYAKTVATIFLKAQQSTREYIGQLKTLSVVDTSNRAQVVSWTTGLIGSVNNLVNEGVAGIKNPDARNKIQSLLAPIPGAIRLIADVLGIVVQQTSSIGPCTNACASLIFTEVKLGPKYGSTVDRAGHSVSRAAVRILSQSQEGIRTYRCATPGRGGRNQRPSRSPDPDIPRAAQRREFRSDQGLGFST